MISENESKTVGINIPWIEVMIIIPTYGAFDYASRCAHSLYSTIGTSHSNVIAVIDDASPEWNDVDWSAWPSMNMIKIHFKERGGLTRSWNEGLRLARELGCEYTLCGNSDLIFTYEWYRPLRRALNTDLRLVGPITNAPGHCPWQNASNFGDFGISDDSTALTTNGYKAMQMSTASLPSDRINGFCMLARTETWWAGAYNSNNVFNPRYTMTGNEDELQKRWKGKGWNIGFCPRSYVFHYRSVSRPESLGCKESKGAFRPVRQVTI